MRIIALIILMLLEVYFFYKGFYNVDYNLYAYFFLLLSIIIVLIQAAKPMINKTGYKKAIAGFLIFCTPFGYKKIVNIKIERYRNDRTTEFKGYFSEGFTTVEAFFKKDKTFLIEYSVLLACGDMKVSTVEMDQKLN